MSAVETVVNVSVGYGVSVALQMVMFPVLGLAVSVGQNLFWGAVFTVVSIIRSYTLRRVFERFR